MLGMNRVILTGRVGNDPTVSYTPNGTPQVRLSLAVPKPPYKSKDGQKVQPDPNWFQIWIYGPAAENCATYLVKGQQIGVEGTLQRRDFTGGDGNEVRNYIFVSASRVIFGNKPRSQTPAAPDAEHPESPGDPERQTELNEDTPTGDDLPF